MSYDTKMNIEFGIEYLKHSYNNQKYQDINFNNSNGSIENKSLFNRALSYISKTIHSLDVSKNHEFFFDYITKKISKYINTQVNMSDINMSIVHLNNTKLKDIPLYSSPIKNTEGYFYNLSKYNDQFNPEFIWNGLNWSNEPKVLDSKSEFVIIIEFPKNIISSDIDNCPYYLCQDIDSIYFTIINCTNKEVVYTLLQNYIQKLTSLLTCTWFSLISLSLGKTIG